jgi:hypothetical protein
MKFFKIDVNLEYLIFENFKKLNIFSILNIETYGLNDKCKLYVC